MLTATRRKLKILRRVDGEGETVVYAVWWEGRACKGIYRLAWEADDMEGVCRVTSPASERYAVTCGPGGVTQSCTCPDYHHKRRRRFETCKHMDAVSALIRERVFVSE